jgi:hypothetical protein
VVDEDGVMPVPERADDPVDQGSVLVMVLSIPVALDFEEDVEDANVKVETVTVIISVFVVVDATGPVEDGDTRVLLVQMGPLPDNDVDKAPAPDDTDVVDHGRADPVVRINVVPF